MCDQFFALLFHRHEWNRPPPPFQMEIQVSVSRRWLLVSTDTLFRLTQRDMVQYETNYVLFDWRHSSAIILFAQHLHPRIFSPPGYIFLGSGKDISFPLFWLQLIHSVWSVKTGGMGMNAVDCKTRKGRAGSAQLEGPELSFGCCEGEKVQQLAIACFTRSTVV